MLFALILALDEPLTNPLESESRMIVFEMANATYQLPVPDGYCVPRIVPPAAKGEVSNSGGHVISKPIYLQLCNDAGQLFGDQDFIMVKYLKNRSLGFANRKAFITSFAPAIQNADFIRWLESDKLIDGAEAKTEQEVGREIALNVRAQALGSDDTCVYNGSRISAIDSLTGKTETMKAISCTTMVDETLVMIDIVGNEERNVSYPLLARKVRDVVNSITKQE